MGGGVSGRILALALAAALLAGIATDLAASSTARASHAGDAPDSVQDGTSPTPPTGLSGRPGPTPAWTPFLPNVRVNVGGSPLGFQVEPTLTINSQGRVFAGWKEAGTADGSGRRVGFSYSTDGGMTWARNILMPVVFPGDLQSDAWLTVTKNDRVFLTRVEYNNREGIAVTNTTDGVNWGTTWFYDDAPNFADKESAAHDAAGNLYWVWNTDSSTEDLAFARSDDGGASWTPRLIISDRSGTIGGIVQVAANGTVFATWHQFSTGNIMFDRSFDGGASWGTDVRVNDISGFAQGQGSWYNAMPAMVVAPNGTIYVSWGDQRNGNMDIMVSHSVDGGTTWSAGVLVNDDASTARQWMADLALDPFGILHVAWEDQRIPGFQNIYYANSTDGGQTFGPNVRVSNVGTAESYIRPGDYFAMEAARNGTVDLVWTDGRGADLDIYFATLPPNRYKLDTVPPGLSVRMDAGPMLTAPYFFDCTAGTIHSIDAPDPQVVGSTRYLFDHWSDGGGKTHSITCGTTATFTAYFRAEYQVTLDTMPPNLNLTIDNIPMTAPVSYWWAAGSTHVLDVPSPQVQGATRYLFTAWSNAGAQNHSVTPSAPVTLSAEFVTEFEVAVMTAPPGLTVTVDGTNVTAPQTYWWADASTHTLDAPSPQGGGPTRSAFTDWSDGGAQAHAINVTAPATVTANFGAQHEITITTLPANLSVNVDGYAFPTPYTFWCDDGMRHTIDAATQAIAPSARAVFRSWSDGGTQSHGITCVAPATFTATFDTEYRVDIDTSPSGLIVVVNGTSYTAPLFFWVTAGSTRTVATASPQPGVTGVRFVWSAWTDGGAPSHGIVVNAPMTLLATFGTQYQLTLLSTHGLPVCDAADCWYLGGGIATFLVESSVPGSPGVRYTFGQWSGDLTTLQPVASLLMDAPKTETALWVTEYFLTVVTARGAGTGDGWYADGTSAAFGVSPGLVNGTAGTHYVFTGWSGNATVSTQSGSLSMDGPKTVAAKWRIEHQLTIVSDRGTPRGQGWHAENESVPVSVDSTVTSNGVTYRFAGWSGDATSSDASFAVTMNGPKTIRAAWETVPPSQSVLGGPALWLLPLAAFILILAFFFWRRRRRDEETPPETPPDPPPA